MWGRSKDPVLVTGGQSVRSLPPALRFLFSIPAQSPGRDFGPSLPASSGPSPAQSALPWGDHRRCGCQSPRAAPPVLPALRPPSRTPSLPSPSLSKPQPSLLRRRPTTHCLQVQRVTHPRAPAVGTRPPPSAGSGVWCPVSSLVQGCVLWGRGGEGGHRACPQRVPVLVVNE